MIIFTVIILGIQAFLLFGANFVDSNESFGLKLFRTVLAVCSVVSMVWLIVSK